MKNYLLFNSLKPVRSILLVPALLLLCSMSAYPQSEASITKLQPLQSPSNEKLPDSVVTRTESVFPGNKDAWLHYLIKTLRYPREAMERNVQGSVVVKFTVDEKGKLKNVHAITGAPELQAEATRVVKQSGRWIPAKENGKAIQSEKAQVITFQRESPVEVPPGNVNTPRADTDTSAASPVEIESSFPGGPVGWLRYLNRAFKYPETAVRNGIQGTVVVQFMLDAEGNVSGVEAIGGPTEGGLREQSVKIIQNSGKWIPATRNGVPLKSYKKQSITFSLYR